MLVAFNKSIIRVYAREHGAAMAQRHPLAADDILPISLFVLVRSNLRRLVLLQQMLTTLCDPQLETGEVRAAFLSSSCLPSITESPPRSSCRWATT